MAASSTFELNDTLQITKDQWFPVALDIRIHQKTPYKLSDLEGKIYTFTWKSWLRNFVAPPVRCFLVENIDGKRIYRGQCHILSTTIDYIKRKTSGTYTIIKIFSPEEMKYAFTIVDRFEDMNYFN